MAQVGACMILGRSKALWLALIAAALNTLVGFDVWTMTLQQLALLNALAVAVIGILANEENPTTAGTFEMTTKAPASGTVTTQETSI